MIAGSNGCFGLYLTAWARALPVYARNLGDMSISENDEEFCSPRQSTDQDNALKLIFVVTSSAHSAGSHERTPSTLVPRAELLPSLVYRCAVESAVLVNPAHSVQVYVRTESIDLFLKAEEEQNPAFKVSIADLFPETG